MKESVQFLGLFSCCLAWGQSDTLLVRGKVTLDNVPLQNVNVQIEHSSYGTTSNANGDFEISAAPGDMIPFTYVVRVPVKKRIVKRGMLLNIPMVQDITTLDEVTVSSSMRKSQKDLAITYTTDHNIIKSTYGYVLKEQSAGYMTVVDGKELKRSSLAMMDALRDKFPGLLFKRGFLNENPSAYILGQGGVLFEVDGVVSKSLPVGLTVDIIDRLALVYGKVTAQRWGSGGGGVLIINTKRVRNGAVEPGTDRPCDREKLRTNSYKGDALPARDLVAFESLYIQDLDPCKYQDDVKGVHPKYKNNFGSSPSFVLEIYNTFSIRFANEKLADEILADHMQYFKGNPIPLKALAFMYQAHGKPVKANECYIQLFIMSPDKIQSYLDLATSYREIGEYKKAAHIFARYIFIEKHESSAF